MTVISLDGNPIDEADGEPNEAVVRALEDALERARAGRIQGVAMAWLDERARASWHAFGFVGGFSLVGALEHVKADVVAANGTTDQ